MNFKVMNWASRCLYIINRLTSTTICVVVVVVYIKRSHSIVVMAPTHGTSSMLRRRCMEVLVL